MSNERLARRILVEIDRNPSISQRQLSVNLGVSIGIVNWHMKRFVTKGLVKLQTAPVRRYLYYLTPAGFAEKARLTAEYLRVSFDIFRRGRLQYEVLSGICTASYSVGDDERIEHRLDRRRHAPQCGRPSRSEPETSGIRALLPVHVRYPSAACGRWRSIQ